VDSDIFESRQRDREWFHSLTVPPSMWAVIRMDGRSFTKLTEVQFEKPFDLRFSNTMVKTAETMLTELGGVYVYTESDEISLLLDPEYAMFGRKLEKLVSISAGIASATFTLAIGEPVHFDSRLWIGATTADVVDYFSWRQADAGRAALNAWCYWTLRNEGKTARKATSTLIRANSSAKNELLFARGINFANTPAWQRRGIGLWHETVEHVGRDPRTGVETPTTRRRVSVERELPVGDEYRELIRDLLIQRLAVKGDGDV
jgi:tRNA(His) guanylyltransferase